jgi:hypothetical protein
MTNDTTIYSLANSCKGMNKLLNIHRKEITWSKYNTHNYKLYHNIPNSCCSGNQNIDQKTAIDEVNIVSSTTEIHKMSMHLFTLMLLHRYDVAQPYDIISSIKIKGDVSSITLTVGKDIHMQFSIVEYIKKQILNKDDNKYIEILTPFINYIPTCCLKYNDAFMSLQSHGGDVVVEITHAKLKDAFLLPKTVHGRTPVTFFSKTFDEVVLDKITIPMSSTWNDTYACLYFDRSMSNVLDRIELIDPSNTTIFCIAAKRLEAYFIQKRIDMHKWLLNVGGYQCKNTIHMKNTKYIVPLSGHGGMHNIILWLKHPTTQNLCITGVRWNSACVEFQEPSQE